jgi:heme exporter protein C
MVLGWILVAATFGLIGFYLPPRDATIGESYLIFFIHFPSAICSMLFFLFAGVLSLDYLIRRRPASDLWASTAVEVGVLGCTITLLTGSIWAKAAWGLWWNNADPRLMTVAIMWLTYLAYLVLRSTLEEPTRKARFSAVFGILAAVNVPLVWFAIRLFKPVSHPEAIVLRDPEMVITRWFGVMAFLFVYTALWRLRVRLGRERTRSRLLEEGFARTGL